MINFIETIDLSTPYLRLENVKTWNTKCAKFMNLLKCYGQKENAKLVKGLELGDCHTHIATQNQLAFYKNELDTHLKSKLYYKP